MMDKEMIGCILLFLLQIQIDMERVNLDTVKPWISNKVLEILGIEDDVFIDYVINMLESERVSIDTIAVDNKLQYGIAQINHTLHCCKRKEESIT